MSQIPKDGTEVVLLPLKKDQSITMGKIDSDDTGTWLCKDVGQSITGWNFLSKFFKGWRYLVLPKVKVEWHERIDSMEATIEDFEFSIEGDCDWFVSFGSNILGHGHSNSIEEAQAAAIAWYNEHIAGKQGLI